MRFHVIRLQTPNPAQSPIRVVEHETGREVGWVNRYLDRVDGAVKGGGGATQSSQKITASHESPHQPRRSKWAAAGGHYSEET